MIYCSTFLRSALFFSGIRASLRLKSRCTSTPALGTEREERKFLSFFCVWREPSIGRCVRCGMALYEQARQATPQPPQANASALAIMQSRSTHLNMRLRGYDSDLLLDLFKVCAIFLAVSARVCDLKVAALRPRLWVLRERNESFSLFFVFGFLCLAIADLWSLCALRYGGSVVNSAQSEKPVGNEKWSLRKETMSRCSYLTVYYLILSIQFFDATLVTHL